MNPCYVPLHKTEEYVLGHIIEKSLIVCVRMFNDLLSSGWKCCKRLEIITVSPGCSCNCLDMPVTGTMESDFCRLLVIDTCLLV